jgi:HTH-type transcriptional repressor of NAD biosynthesis genes
MTHEQMKHEQMNQALVLGKFMPFQLGHQALINFAAKQADQLIVLVCASDKEAMPGELRQQWIAETYAKYPNIRVDLLHYREDELPNSSESSRVVSQVWAKKIKALYPKLNIIVSSEPYGDYMAEYMGVEHRLFDQAREKVPISATQIRQDPIQYWDYLPKAVKPYYHRKIVLLGTESTGKSTMAAALAAHFGQPLVREAGRDLIPDSTAFELKDLYRVAEAHQSLLEAALAPLPALIVMDTDLHITQSYAQFSFGQYLDLPKSYYETQRADLYLYLNMDVPLVQDGTRMSDSERAALEAQHRQTIAHYQLPITEISGSWEERWQQALAAISDLY